MTGRPPSVLLGVTGGIAAYKSAEVVRRLRDLGCEVTVAATPSALNFVGEATWAALSGRPVLTSLWQRAESVGHVSAARAADVILVAPATADFMARIAAGRSDDVLSAIVLMAKAPVVLAPAMHTEMWLNAATAANVALLRGRGMLVLEPDSGRLTGPDSGPGRLPAPESLADIAYCAAGAGPDRPLRGRRVVVTAGGTREAWDPVRWLGNRSSGRMGYAIASAAVALGAEVVVIASNVDLPDVAGALTLRAGSHAELESAVVSEAARADAVVMSAAVADFTVLAQAEKVKKTAGEAPVLHLRQTSDILAGLSRNRRQGRPLLIGFAAETASEPQVLIRLAAEKLAAKGCDIIVANDVSGSAVFGEDRASVLILDHDGPQLHLADEPKLIIGGAVCTVIAGRLG